MGRLFGGRVRMKNFSINFNVHIFVKLKVRLQNYKIITEKIQLSLDRKFWPGGFSGLILATYKKGLKIMD